MRSGCSSRRTHAVTTRSAYCQPVAICYGVMRESMTLRDIPAAVMLNDESPSWINHSQLDSPLRPGVKRDIEPESSASRRPPSEPTYAAIRTLRRLPPQVSADTPCTPGRTIATAQRQAYPDSHCSQGYERVKTDPQPKLVVGNARMVLRSICSRLTRIRASTSRDRIFQLCTYTSLPSSADRPNRTGERAREGGTDYTPSGSPSTKGLNASKRLPSKLEALRMERVLYVGID